MSATIRSGVSAIALAIVLAVPAAAQTAPAPAPRPASPPPAKKAGDIVVTGTRGDVVSTADRISFNIANDLQAQTGTVADALRNVPGVEVDLDGKVSLRGDSNVTILVDGRPSTMLSGESRGQVLLSMPAGQIERVEVITNPSAALSPEGSGGAINLVTKRARQDMKSASAKLTFGGPRTYGIGLNASQSAGKVTVVGDLNYRRFGFDSGYQLRRSRLNSASGAWVDSRLDADADIASIARTARFGLDYDLDKTNRLSTEINLRKFTTDLDRDEVYETQGPEPDYLRLSEGAFGMAGASAKASWRKTFDKDHELVADVEIDRNRLKQDNDAAADYSNLTQNFDRIRNRVARTERTVKLDYKRPLRDEDQLNIGYNGVFGASDFDGIGRRGPDQDDLPIVPGLTNSFDYDQDVHALYGTYRLRSGKLEVQPGLRLEQADIAIDQITDAIAFKQDYLRLYPTLHLAFELPKDQQLRASYSRRIQRPSPQDLNPYTIYLDPLNRFRGNPFLKPEVTNSFELGWQKRKSGGFLSATAYYRRSTGGISNIILDLGDGVFLTTRENLSRSRRVGLDLIANGKLGTTINYNLSGTLGWLQIDPGPTGFARKRSGSNINARGNVTWQPSKKDQVQLQAFVNGRSPLPQGYRKPFGMLNLGYKRTVSERVSVVATAQNVLDTGKITTVLETPLLRDRQIQRGMGRAVFLGLNLNWGKSNRRPDQAIEFQQPDTMQ